jgi:hypothetical protein
MLEKHVVHGSTAECTDDSLCREFRTEDYSRIETDHRTELIFGKSASSTSD